MSGERAERDTVEKVKVGLSCLVIVACIAGLSGCRQVALSRESTGVWYSEDYEEITEDVFQGTRMTLESSEDGTRGSITLECISDPPQSRVAYVDATWELANTNQAKFVFDDDGWGNHGTGIIEFGEDRIVVKTDVVVLEGSNWHMFNGSRGFVRPSD